ncbi:polysaccharide lyase 8 family protein [Paenibacillus oryzisoli]|uniref:Hyaluronate lyase n=1 Tax=Paenibacillus oryzisoli TaxID=1850517 RepID=A0A198AMD5_9BACL|nr:polysaccharide lyase 8 family protein [Paenibacillus oryzisoli]OAS22068.1 hypothetical protein A8708_33375 [Paenibacillus oryzisoli]
MRQLTKMWRKYIAGDTIRPEAVQQVGEYQRTMLHNRELLWQDVPYKDDASDLNIIMARLREMAIVVSTPTSPSYTDSKLLSQLVLGLEWIYEHRYNEVCEPYGNWWYWEIGVPIALLETIIALEGLNMLSTTTTLIEKLLRPVDKYVGDPAFHAQWFRPDPPPSTGANLVWKVTAVALSAAIQRDEHKLHTARSALLPVFCYTETGDGFYEDGSFIQHNKYAYTGGYGKGLLHDTARLMVWLHGTQWELPKEAVSLTYQWIKHSFVPLMFRGMLFDMTSGREISRRDTQNHENGHSVITSCLRLSHVLDISDAVWLLSEVKHWILTDTYKSYLYTAPPDTTKLARLLLENNHIQPAPEEAFCKMFANMDRAVLRGPGFVFAVSMFSNRMYTYESINGENLKGWYTAQGMTYLYNGDLGQYADAYWPTVNPYRLPGTTVTDKLRENGAGKGRLSTRSSVGGAVLHNKYGAIAMELADRVDEEDDVLTGLKSWFLLGDRVVALGSNITNLSPSSVETIIENRKLGDQGYPIILADGSPICVSLGQVETIHPRWIHLTGSVPESNVGYVFPKASAVQALREMRQGSWRDLNLTGSTETINRSFLTLWFDHGEATMDCGGDYAYVILPNQTVRQTVRFAERAPIRIVAQDDHCHAVEDEEQGLFAAHFWTNAWHKSGLISCSGRASIVLEMTDTGWSLAVADPTHEQMQTIEMVIELPDSGVLRQSERIQILSREERSIQLMFDPAGAAGGSYEIAFSWS